MAILVTGGAGDIGSHIVLELLQNGYEAVVIDNLSNSSMESLRRVEFLFGKRIHISDITNKNSLKEIFTSHSISGVIHFTGSKSVSESIRDPIL